MLEPKAFTKELSAVDQTNRRDSGPPAYRSERPLDTIDWQIITELQSDGRQSFSELGRRINLSPPAVAERVRRLEESGVITGYRAQVDPARAGYPFLGFVQMRCSLNKCLLKTSTADDYPEVVELHKLSGDHCTMLKVRTVSLEHLEGLLERLGTHGELRSHVVLSSQYEDRPVEPPVADHLIATQHKGWTRP